MADKTYYRQWSKREWYATDGEPTDERINVGSLQRIADACELMARNHALLVNERDMYKRWHEDAIRQRDHAYRRVNSLKGVVTRLKKAGI